MRSSILTTATGEGEEICNVSPLQYSRQGSTPQQQARIPPGGHGELCHSWAMACCIATSWRHLQPYPNPLLFKGWSRRAEGRVHLSGKRKQATAAVICRITGTSRRWRWETQWVTNGLNAAVKNEGCHGQKMSRARPPPPLRCTVPWKSFTSRHPSLPT